MSMNCSGCEYDGFIYWKDKKVSYCKYFKQTMRNMDEIKSLPYHHFQHGWCPHDTRQEEKAEEAQYYCPNCGAKMKGIKDFHGLDKDSEEAIDMAIEALQGDWIPVSERLPKDLEEVVVTWVNRNPPVYYRHEKDKPQTGFAVLYRDTWHWWDSTIVDVLAEYGLRCDIEHISEDIEILAWRPLPEPYKGGDTE